MRYHSFDRVRICETTGMQDGYLRIDVVNSENNFPIEGGFGQLWRFRTDAGGA